MPTDAHTTDSLFDQLTEAIEQNGTLTETQRKKLMLMTIREVYNNTLCIPSITKRVEQLEQKSIWMWAERHPKASTFIGATLFTVTFIVFTALSQIGINEVIKKWLGF